MLRSSFWFPFYEICVQYHWGIKFWDPVRTQTLAVRVQLLLGWNTYLLFKTDIVNFVWKSNEGEAESIALLIFVLWRCLNLWWMRGGGVEQKALFRTSWNLIFSSKDLSRSNKHDTILYWLNISTFYFYEPLPFQIFLSWKFKKNLGFPLSTITFTVGSHVDNHFYKYICLFRLLCSSK